MKQKIFISLCVVTLGLSSLQVHCLQDPEIIEHKAVVIPHQESFDEFDVLVDEAMADETFKDRPQIQEPSGARLFLMQCGVPLVSLYSSAVLKYRAIKALLKKYCIDPVVHTVGSYIHRGQDASQATSKE